MSFWDRLYFGSWFHKLSLKNYAEEDGRRAIPEPGQTSQRELELTNRAQRLIDDLHRKHIRKLQALHARLNSTVQLFCNLVDSFVDERTKLNRRLDCLGRSVILKRISGKVYLLLMLLIAVAEFVFNVQAFEVFQKPFYMTLLMALTVAVLLPLIAHICGAWLRQGGGRPVTTALKVAALLGVTIAGLVGINWARMQYLAEIAAESGQEVRPGAIVGYEHAFLLINLFVLAGAIVLSSFAHDPDEEVDMLHKRSSKLDRKLDKLDGAVEHLLAAITARRDALNAELKSIQSQASELITYYRQCNLLARDPSRRSDVFTTGPLVPELPALPQIDSKILQSFNEARQKRVAAKKLSPGHFTEVPSARSRAAS